MPYLPYLPAGDFLHTDDYDGKTYVPEWNPDSRSGRGVATHWSDPAWSSGRTPDYDRPVCALPMDLPGFEKTEGSPIPWLPGTTAWSDEHGRHVGTWHRRVFVHVTDPKTMNAVMTELVDLGPNLNTGAAIDLSAGAKRALGKDPGKNFYVTFRVLD